MVMAAAAAAASSSDDHELLLNRFLPYSATSSSSSSQLYLTQTGGSQGASLNAPTNGAGGGSGLVSSGNLRDAHSAYSSLHSGSHSVHAHPGVVAGRSSTEAAVAAIYGGIPDVIPLD